MADLTQVTGWIDRYVAAWNSNEPTAIGDLFTDDAEYLSDPYGPAWSGRETIVAEWLRRRDKPGETTFSWQPVVVTDDVAVIEGETTYPTRTYSNLWLIRLDAEGRCRHFTEWAMKQPKKRLPVS
jgi:uncharacterized protein (TIGR02246 family)